jgi:hypothetical protein
MPYIIFAAILGGCIGFFGCGIFASHAIKRANLEGYKEGLAATNRKLLDLLEDLRR